jgi:hypothetical protein
MAKGSEDLGTTTDTAGVGMATGDRTLSLVERLEALDAKRTPGPWSSSVPVIYDAGALARLSAPMETLGFVLPADAAFAAALANAWPEIRIALTTVAADAKRARKMGR